MASPATPQQPPRQAADPRLVAYERFIENQLQKTGSTVKLVDAAAGLMVLATAALGWLLLAALFDHWLVPGGLGLAGRLLFFVVLVGAGGWYAVAHIVPVLLGRINPIYAAYTIERHAPGLKNSLLNLLLFRKDAAAVPPEVYEAIEEQAAKRLSSVPLEAVVDRGPIIRIGYVLIGIVLAFALYMIASPKDPLNAAGRVILPWADIQPSTRVTIANIEPGNATLVRGEPLAISADVRGIEGDEPVTVFYTSEDGKAVNQPVAMHIPADGYRFTATLPEGGTGVYEKLRYRIKAGDAVSPTFHVDVVAAPTILVESVEYAYPKYTGFSDRRAAGGGDIRAIEATRVTIRARANHPIQGAAIDFNCDGVSDLPMQVDGQEAVGKFTLRLQDDRRTPQYHSYCLRFTNTEGRKNRDPVEYQIDVVPDLPPEVALRRPKQDLLEVALNETVEIEVQAVDPDFALQRVELQGDVGSQTAFRAALLEKERQGQFVSRYQLTPSRAGLKVGDEVEYFAVAIDNKSPRPNRVESARKKLRITSPMPDDRQQDQLAQNDPPPEPPQDDQQQDQQPDREQGKQGDQQQRDPQPQDQDSDPQDAQDQPEQGADGQENGAGEGDPSGQPDRGGQDGKQPEDRAGQPEEGEQREGEPGDDGEGSEEGVSSDGSQDGDAFDRIREHLDRQREQQQPEQQQGAKDEQTSQEGEGEQDQSQGEQAGEGPKQPDAGQQPPGAGDDHEQPGHEDGQKPQPDAGEKAPDGQKPDPQAGQQPDEGAQPDGQQPGDEKQPGGQQPDGQQPGEPAGDDKKDQGEGTGEGRQPAQPEGKDGEAAGQKPDDPQSKDPDGNEQPGAKQDGADPRGKTDPTQAQPKPGDGEPGGEDQREQGKAGAGKEGDEQGSPEPQNDIEPKTDKKDRPPGTEESAKDQPQSPAHGKKESDSEGEMGGDKPGGGEQGGGQPADRRGTGSDGQNTEADDGSGQGTEPGDGEDSDQPGEAAKSDQATDQEGKKEQGQSDQRQPGREGEGGKSDPDQPQPDQRGDGGREPQPGDASDPTGGGEPGREGAPQARPDQADDPNLEYARKATDLVLDELDHQLANDQVDQELLDKLNWNKDDMKRFLDRWKQMKQAAEAAGPQGDQGRQELQEALRSLGLSQDRVRRGANRTADDLRNLREAHRVAPPSEYADQVKAYSKGLSKSQPER